MERPRWQQASRQAGTGQQRAEHVGRARQSAAIRMWRGCAGRICRRTSVGRQSTGNARRRKERHVSGCGGVCEFSRHRFKLQRERERERERELTSRFPAPPPGPRRLPCPRGGQVSHTIPTCPPPTGLCAVPARSSSAAWLQCFVLVVKDSERDQDLAVGVLHCFLIKTKSRLMTAVRRSRAAATRWRLGMPAFLMCFLAQVLRACHAVVACECPLCDCPDTLRRDATY